MKRNNRAEISIVINADKIDVWQALTQPELVKEYFLGTDLYTIWEPGSPIKFTGEWQGKKYYDKGTVLAYKQEEMLQYNYWSCRSGMEEKPENYVIITYRMGGEDGRVAVTIIQENIPDEKVKTHFFKNWEQRLKGLKEMLEAEKVF